MNSTQEAKIKQFANDRAMNEAVKSVLLKSFLKKRPLCDVNLLASGLLSVHNLDEAWQEIEGYRADNEIESKSMGNRGV